MRHSESITNIAAALAAAAAQFAPVQKNREVSVTMRSGGSYSFKYATLDGIVGAVRPALSENGLVLVQSVVHEETDQVERLGDGTTVRHFEREEMLETRLIHSSGEWFANLTPVLVAEGENSAQAYGSAITYGRRYGITQLLCIVADEDDDGNAAAGNVARSKSTGSSRSGGGAVISEKQCGLLRAKLREAKGDEAALCQFLGVDALEALPRGGMDRALEAIAKPVPAILQGAMGAGGDAAAEAAKRKGRHDEALVENLESMQYIRSMLAPGGRPEMAAEEWRRLSEDSVAALWLAPSKGGWFTTAERTALRDALSANPPSADADGTTEEA